MKDEGNNRDGFSTDLLELQEVYGSNPTSIVERYFDEIEQAITMKVPSACIAEKLNSRFGLSIKPSYLLLVLHRVRKKKAACSSKNNATPTVFKEQCSNTQEIRLEVANGYEEIENIVDYRLPECIRSNVLLVDGQLQTNFKKNTIFNSEIRHALAKLERKLLHAGANI